MKQFFCRLRGHGPFEQYVLHESSSIRYGVEYRNLQGRALSWPTCTKCGWTVVTTIWK